jgi:diguanylate cyclase (GGDEF)-like protein
MATRERSLLFLAYGITTAVVAAAAGWAATAERELAEAALWSLLGAVGVVACLRRTRDGDVSMRRGAWLIVAGAAVSFTTGTTIALLNATALSAPVYLLLPGLLAYPLLGVGLVLNWSPSGRIRWIDGLDAAIAAMGIFLVSWGLAIYPAAQAGAAWLTAMIGHPIGSLFVVAVAILGLYVSSRPRARPVLDLLAANSLLAMTATFAVDVKAGRFTAVTAPEVVWFWISFHVLLGAAALSPVSGSPRVPRVTEPGRPALTIGRAALFSVLALAGLVGWAIVVTRSGPGVVAEAGVPVGVGTVVSLLLVWRLALTARIVQQRARQLAEANQKQQQLQGMLEYRATHDGLTGLVNRGVLQNAMDAAFGQRAYPLSVLMLDLDGFKQANDSRGHLVGDQVLTHVAKRLTTVLPEGSTVARLGGDEFAALLPDTDADALAKTAGRVGAVLRRPYPVEDEPITLSASIGVLPIDAASTAQNATEALRRADIAMYDAKNAGRDTYVVYGEPAARTGAPTEPRARPTTGTA